MNPSEPAPNKKPRTAKTAKLFSLVMSSHQKPFDTTLRLEWLYIYMTIYSPKLTHQSTELNSRMSSWTLYLFFRFIIHGEPLSHQAGSCSTKPSWGIEKTWKGKRSIFQTCHDPTCLRRWKDLRGDLVGAARWSGTRDGSRFPRFLLYPRNAER